MVSVVANKFRFLVENPHDLIQAPLTKGRHAQQQFLWIIRVLCATGGIENVLIAGAHIGTLAIPLSTFIKGYEYIGSQDWLSLRSN